MLTGMYQAETLEQLNSFIQEAPVQEELRQALLAEFERYMVYENIQEWNRLVRLCEALRITGWGEREPVEAIAEKWINGSYYSGLRTRTFDVVEGTSGGWSKHGNTFVLDDRRDLTDYGIAVLATQRNPLPKNPVRLVGSGNYQRSAQPFVDSLEQKRELLEMVEVLDGKLKKKKLPYRTDLLREDLTAVLAGW